MTPLPLCYSRRTSRVSCSVSSWQLRGLKHEKILVSVDVHFSVVFLIFDSVKENQGFAVKYCISL